MFIQLLLPVVISSSTLPSPSVPDPTTGRKLVFDQDFGHLKALDPKKWIFDDGPVYNNEKEKYTNSAARNAWIENPNLIIEARKSGADITSARLETVGSWNHPYVEVVAAVPKGKGTWPAIWMLNDRLRHPGNSPVGWPKCGEIDIMENVGFDPASFHYSLHSDKYNWMKPAQRTKATDLADPQGFHKFAMDCRPKQIVFSVDGQPVYTVENTEDIFDAWPYHDPYYLILNLAIGGTWGGREGVDDSIFPTRFLVRSVKIYQ